MTQIDELFVQIGKFVLKQSDFTFSRAQTIVKQHTEKLSQSGDIGFPTTIQPWLNAIENPATLQHMKQIIGDNEDEFAHKLIEISSEWLFPIKSVKFKQFRCLLFLDRQKCYDGILKTVLDDASYGQWHHANDAKTIYTVQLVKSNDNTLVEHRCTLVSKVLTNLLRFSGFKTQPPNGNGFDELNLMEILVTCARRDGAKRVNRQMDIELNNNAGNGNAYVKSKLIVCGSVTSKSGLIADDFIQRRSLEMQKMAETKHGCSNEKSVLDKCQKLGTAIVSFDLLKIKHFNAIDFERVMTTTTTVKGAAFVLYNVARLQTLLATFHHQVSRGFYGPLPDFDQIDFGLLREEEEWQMFYVYIVGFPSMLERCISGIDNSQIAIHLLCTFLSNLSALFSVYYHRVKILTDNLPQLAPVMYARIYLLKALREIFLKSLAILEIEPLDQIKQCGQVVLDVLKEHPVDDVLENIHQIASTLSMASEDTDSSVRAALAQVIPDIFARCIEIGNPELEYFLFDRMLEIVLRFLKNEENMVRESAFASIKVLLLKKYLSASRIEEFVCPTSVQLLNLEGLPEDVVRERHPDAFVIMALLAPIIGAEKTREYFLDKFLELCTNESYDVRKMCAVFCPHLCKVMGIEVSEKHLIPAFLRLCEDKVWDVRKAAADSIRIIALLCSHPFRRDKLCPAFYKLMNDSCRWVYRAASESLGLFISSFAKKCILGVAYRPNGDLYIPNPADADYKQHSQTDILSNYESYESWFEKSATAPEYPKNFVQQQKQFNNKIDFDAIVKVSRESLNENPHFSLPETFHNALSFRNYDNHGFSLSITNLLDTFIIQSEHNNGHSHQRIPRGGHFDLASPIMEPINEYHHLRKNTPRDFPMIVRKAMEKQEEENTRKFTIKAKIPRQNAVSYMQAPQDDRGTNSYQSLPPPPPPAIGNTEPDTPSIENAPSSIDFSSAVNLNLSNSLHSNETDNENNKVNNTSDINLNFKADEEDGAYNDFTANKREPRAARFSESSGFSSIPDDDDATGNDFDLLKNTETFMNRINTMQLDDYDDTDDDEHNFNSSKEFEDLDQSFTNMGLEDDDSDINSNLNNSVRPTKTAEEDDDEEVFREFNSHQYWYISPDIPVDMDILLEPEEKKMRIQLEEELELRRFDRVKLINYQPKIVPAELIKYFVSLAHSQDSPVVNYYCAYHFPAVVLTLGRKNWPVMCSLLQLLCNHGIDDIRKTMASSIYQIALIIGRKLATQDLVPVYLRFFEDQDKVKVVALKNLPNFLTVIDRPRYDIIVAALSNCLGEFYEAGWRFREEFAQQILILVKSFGELAWSTHKLNLIGITIKLLRDRVNSIRKIALETMVEICKKLNADECDVICTFLSKHFGSNSNWRHRQIFSEFCHQWMAQEIPLYPDVFNDRLFNIACQLVKDPVPNIRMTIARCFALVLSKQHIDTQRYKVTVIILRKMQSDSDPDVRDVALSCDLPSNEDENNDATRNLSESSTSNTNISTLSTASTVDMNCTDGGISCKGEGDESEVSQDSISLYLDTDEKNTSNEEPSIPSEPLSSQ